MNQIIGGEFKIERGLLETHDKINSSENIVFSSGRCALFAILNDIKCRSGQTGEVLLPDYLCDTVTQTVIDSQWKYNFYHIDEDLNIDFESVNMASDKTGQQVILLINYFGIVSNSDKIDYIRSNYPGMIIIEDNVQAFFSEGKNHPDYSFTSLRKWFPCPDGALVHKFLPGELQGIDLSENYFAKYKFAGNYLKGVPDYIDDSLPLELIEKGEDVLNHNYLCGCSDAGKRIFEKLNLEQISNIRKNNARILHEGLKRLNVSHLYDEKSTPLFVPIFVKNRYAVRKVFFDNNVFVPKHWPRTSNGLNGNNELYMTELSLICDQRYDGSHMLRQLDLLEKCMEGC